MPKYKLEILIKGTDKASGAFRSAGSALQRMGEIAGGIIGAQIIGRIASELRDAASAAISFGKEAVMSAARVQEMDAVLKVLGEKAGLTSDQINEQVETIKDLGITTQVAQTTMAQFIRWNLKSEDAARLARVAQDAAVISMQDSSQALDGLIQGITKMNTRVLRTYGITLTSVVEAQDKYAKTLGKTRADLTATEKIQAVLNEVLAQGETQISGAYVAAMETAGKQLRSMPRHVTELKNALGKPFLDAFSSVIKAATNWLKTLRALAEEGKPLNRLMKALARIIGAVLGRGLEHTSDAVETLTAFINKLADRFEKIANVVENVKDKFAIMLALGVPKWFVTMLKVIGAIWKGFKKFVGAIAAWVFGLMPKVYEVVQRLWPKISDIVINAVNSIRKWIDAHWEPMKVKILDAWNKIKTWVKTHWPAIKEKIINAWNAIKDWVNTHWEPMKEKILGVWAAVKTWIDTHWDETWNKIITTWEAIRKWVDEDWPKIKEDLLATLDGIKAGVDEKWTAIKEALSNDDNQEGRTNLEEWWATTWENIKTIAATIWGTISAEAAAFWAAIEEPLGKVKEALAGLFDKETIENAKLIWKTVTTVFLAVVQLLLGGLAGLAAGFINAFAVMVEVVGRVIDDIARILKGIGLLFKGEGKGWVEIAGGISSLVVDTFGGMVVAVLEFFKGLFDGILEFWTTLDEKLGGAITDFGEKTLGWLKGVFGVSSPSKEMAKIGQNLMQGLAQGIQNSTLAPIQAMGAMAPAVMGAVGGSSTYSRDTQNNYNLTINSRAQAEDVRASFGMMKALGGGGT